MRKFRVALVALVLAVVAAGCAQPGSGGAPAADDQAPPTTSPAPTPDVDGAGTTTTTTTTTRRPPARPSTSVAVATALSYMRREVGMPAPAAGPFRWTGRTTGQVGVHPSRDPNGRPVSGPVTVVSLRRMATYWLVTGTRTRAVQVTEPDPYDRVASPLLVTGRATAFEGHVPVRITEDRHGPDRLLGAGYVLGRGDGVLGPFSNKIAFKAPSGRTGSVIFTDNSAANGEVLAATVVRVRFVTPTPRPRITGVTTVPAMNSRGVLPRGTRSVTFVVKATNADRVEVLYMGLMGPEPPYPVMGRDTTPGNGFRITLRLDKEAMFKVGIQAVGRGGASELWTMAVINS